MSKGTNRTQYLAQTGMVAGQRHRLWDFIYRTSLEKDPLYNVGDTVRLPDKREFTYARSILDPGGISVVLSTIEACGFAGAQGTVGWTSATDTVAVGSTTVTVPAASHDELAVDELRNGYVHIHGSATDGADSMNRGLLGNDASADGAALKLYLDAATDIEIDSSSAYEVFENPYAAVTWAAGSVYAKAGVPAAYVAASLTYVWVQTRGPIWCNSHGTVIENEGMGCMWRSDGSLDSVAYSLGNPTVPDVGTTQYAGHRILGDNANNGPLFMLQG